MHYLFFIVLLLRFSTVSAMSESASSMVSSSEISRMLIGLVLVLLIIFLLALAVKKLQRVNLVSSKTLQTLASTSLGAKEKIVLLKVSRRYLLIGVASGSINLLHDFGEEIPDGFDLEDKVSFASFFNSVVRKSQSEN